MPLNDLSREGNQFILHTTGVMCSTTRELAASEVFEEVVKRYAASLCESNSPLLDQLECDLSDPSEVARLISLLRTLAGVPLEQVVKVLPNSEVFLGKRRPLHRMVEGLYDFWRSLDRFLICHPEEGSESYDQRSHKTFNATVENLMQLVRALYRDICENITGDHPRIYRQVAGCDVALVALDKPWKCPAAYAGQLSGVPFVRQVLMNPPLMLVTPISKRTEQFQKVEANPFQGLSLDAEKLLCYPAQVGPTVVFIYFHQKFMGVGCSLANLFELATDDQIAAGPDAICLYGAPTDQMAESGDALKVLHDDEANGLILAAVADQERFGYFSCLREMILTVHNIVNIKKGRMPYHGAMVRIELNDGKSANVLLVGDAAAGRGETIEALRSAGSDKIRDLTVIASDMGSLEITEDGTIIGYGTETGAFLRLDDLQYGRALDQIDRAIIINPHSSSARAILPVTMLDDVICGYPVDIVLYTNNYEEVDGRHPTIEQFADLENALETFEEAATMVKGTTMSTGVVHTYFANQFGAALYKDLHDGLARSVYGTAMDNGVCVGQIRTRVGIRRYGERGPHVAAQALLDLIGTGWNRRGSDNG